jgi:hypothetical protein
MFFMLKFLLYFTISFLIMNIPIGDKHIFHYMESFTKSYTKPLYGAVKGRVKEAVQTGNHYSKKVFETMPSKVEDQVSTHYSSAAKKEKKAQPAPVAVPSEKELDSYTQEEKSALIRVLKGAH